MLYTPMRDVLDSHFLALVDCFFNHENITYTMHTLASSVKLRSPDHFMSVAKMMLSDTICMTFSDTGFAPFRRDPSIVFEYQKMTTCQLSTIQETMAYLTDVHELIMSPKSSQCVNVYAHESRHAKFMVDPSLVVFAMCVVVYNSNPRRAYLEFEMFCNILLQRLGESQNIPRHLVLQGIDLARANMCIQT